MENYIKKNLLFFYMDIHQTSLVGNNLINSIDSLFRSCFPEDNIPYSTKDLVNVKKIYELTILINQDNYVLGKYANKKEISEDAFSKLTKTDGSNIDFDIILENYAYFLIEKTSGKLVVLENTKAGEFSSAINYFLKAKEITTEVTVKRMQIKNIDEKIDNFKEIANMSTEFKNSSVNLSGLSGLGRLGNEDIRKLKLDISFLKPKDIKIKQALKELKKSKSTETLKCDIIDQENFQIALDIINGFFTAKTDLFINPEKKEDSKYIYDLLIRGIEYFNKNYN